MLAKSIPSTYIPTHRDKGKNAQGLHRPALLGVLGLKGKVDTYPDP